jgi:SAM-dependent methyltransferase
MLDQRTPSPYIHHAMTKRINPHAYDTDKPTFDVYFRNYERVFAPLARRKIRLLELGINRGGSLKLWRDYFKQGVIAAIDINPVTVHDPTGRIRTYQGLQQDTALLDRVRAENAPDGFDVIIDDCSHIGEFTAISFWHLFDRHLKPGGLFVIEDWGTGYMAGWPDGRRYDPRRPVTSLRSRMRPIVERLFASPAAGGFPLIHKALRGAMNRMVRMNFRSHQRGLVGFVKQLVDEAGMDDITCPPWGTPPYRTSRFARIEFTHGQVFIVKAGA